MVSLNTKPNLNHLLTITHHSSHIGTYPPCVRSYTKLWANESFSNEFYLDETSEDVLEVQVHVFFMHALQLL